MISTEIPTPGDEKWEISSRLNAIIANVWGADQVKNREIIENVWKILLGWNLCIDLTCITHKCLQGFAGFFLNVFFPTPTLHY